MGTLHRRISLFYAAIFLLAVVFTISAKPSQGTISQAVNHKPLDTCTFSNGDTMTFGRKAMGGAPTGEDVWRTGNYVATAFHTNGTFVISSPEGGDKIPSGDYTLFFTDQGTPPWTLIISKKSGEWGLPYPGEQYDVVRGPMGSDVLHPPADHPIVGCWQSTGPKFVWMESGRYAAYVKIEAEEIVNGQEERAIR